MGKEDLHVGTLNLRKGAKRESIKNSKECSITFESILEILAYDKEPVVRMDVALNPNTWYWTNLRMIVNGMCVRQ